MVHDLERSASALAPDFQTRDPIVNHAPDFQLRFVEPIVGLSSVHERIKKRFALSEPLPHLSEKPSGTSATAAGQSLSESWAVQAGRSKGTQSLQEQR